MRGFKNQKIKKSDAFERSEKMDEKSRKALALSVKQFRKERDLTQKQLAEKLRVSRSQVQRIEAGEGCSDYVFESYMLLTKNLSDLQVIYDYVKIRVHIADVDYIINDLLKMKKSEFEVSSKFHRGYDMTYEHLHGGILIHFAPEKANVGVLIHMQGKGCRYYEQIMTENGDEWADFFKRCLRTGANATRLDIAINDHRRLLSIPELIEKYQNGEVKTSYKYISVVNPTDEHLNSSGASIYFGKYGSECCWIFYEKDKQLLSKKKIERLEESNIKNRYELRLAQEKANYVMREIIFGLPVEEIPFRQLKYSIDFLDKNEDLPKDKWDVNQKWERFVGDVEPFKIKNEVQEESDFLKKVASFDRTYGAFYSALRRIENEGRTTFLKDIFANHSKKNDCKTEKYYKMAQLHCDRVEKSQVVRNQ